MAKGKEVLVETAGGPAINAALEPIAWVAWDIPDRIAARPDILNEPGDAPPRLMLVTYSNGALKVAATRRPSMMLTDAARIARAMGSWIDGALVSGADVKLGWVAQTLVKRLRLAGYRYIGGGVFERLAIQDALAVLAPIRPIAETPEAPRLFRSETAIPSFLRKENQMLNEEPNQSAVLPSLVVAHTAIRKDQEGRYCLNDLHKAAGGENRHRPSLWLENQQTQELVEEIAKAGIPALAQNQPVSVIKGGSSPGTYVCKELVYAYAMWISAKFHLTVIRAFDSLVMGHRPEIGQIVFPREVERAIEQRAWRLAENERQRLVGLMGMPPQPEDEETVWDIAMLLKLRFMEQMRDIAKQQLRHHKSHDVANWLLNWMPLLGGELRARMT
jgi:KilA-N domain.